MKMRLGGSSPCSMLVMAATNPVRQLEFVAYHPGGLVWYFTSQWDVGLSRMTSATSMICRVFVLFLAAVKTINNCCAPKSQGRLAQRYLDRQVAIAFFSRCCDRFFGVHGKKKAAAGDPSPWPLISWAVGAPHCSDSIWRFDPRLVQ